MEHIGRARGVLGEIEHWEGGALIFFSWEIDAPLPTLLYPPNAPSSNAPALPLLLLPMLNPSQCSLSQCSTPPSAPLLSHAPPLQMKCF